MARKPLQSLIVPAIVTIQRALCRACRGALAAGGSRRAPVAPAVHLRRGSAGGRLAESACRGRPVGSGQVTRLCDDFHTLTLNRITPVHDCVQARCQWVMSVRLRQPGCSQSATCRSSSHHPPLRRHCLHGSPPYLRTGTWAPACAAADGPGDDKHIWCFATMTSLLLVTV